MPHASQPEPLTFIRNIVFVFALYLYFAGWLHAYYFFLRFGISLNSVDIPAYYFFIYSYSVFGTGWGLLIFSLIIASLVLGLKWEATRPHIVLVIFILLFPAVFYAARAAGQKDASKKRSGSSNTVRFLFKKDAEDRLDAGFVDLNKSEQLQLLTLTKDRYFVFSQPKGEGNAQPNATVYSIAVSDVVLAEIDLPSPRN